MWSVFDNLNAVIIGGVVMLLLISMQQRKTLLLTDQLSTYAAKRNGDELVSWLENDLSRVGENLRAGEQAVEVPETDSLGNTARFLFRYDSLATSDTVRIETEYRLVRDTTRRAYRLERWVRRNGGYWHLEGGSPPTLYSFYVALLDEQGQVASQPETARFLEVRFALVPPFAPRTQATLSQFHYGNTFLIRIAQ